jgi:hypothetical protein
MVCWLAMDFGYRFLSDFLSNVHLHSHCWIEYASAFVKELSESLLDSD